MRGATRHFYARGSSVRISIHAPHAGCDRITNVRVNHIRVFQSTHPMRGATKDKREADARIYDFNPRTPCGVRLFLNVL